MGPYTYETCCFKDVLTEQDLAGLQALHSCCPAGAAPGLRKADAFWCGVRESAMLSWDMREKYKTFMELPAADLGSCAAGTLTMMVWHLAFRVQGGHDVTQLPTWVWAREAMRVVAKAGQLRNLLESGFHIMFPLSLVRVMGQVPGSVCGKVDAGQEPFLAKVRKAVDNAVSGTALAIPPDEAAAFMTQSAINTNSACPLPLVIALAAVAGAFEDLGAPSAALHDLASAKLASLADPFLELVAAAWPAVELLERQEHPPRVNVSITKPIVQFVNEKLRPPFDTATDYVFRVFPHREIASDGIRLWRMPFCGMRPFIKLIESVANSGRDELSLIEGGPHLGDCTVWAAAALERSNTRFNALGIEAMSDAAALFAESVRLNNFERVRVLPRALAAEPGRGVDMTYESGRNGQATEKRLYEQCVDCVQVKQVPSTSIDAEWKGPLDVLKLSVNGAELRTLQGARKLLNRRNVCLVLMHAFKVEMGRDRPDFSVDLFNVLNDNGLEILLHKDRKEEGIHSTRTIQNAKEMDEIFLHDGNQLPGGDYIFARSKSPDCVDVVRHLQL
jgi:FkbM family methyltransferase